MGFWGFEKMVSIFAVNGLVLTSMVVVIDKGGKGILQYN